MGPEIKNQYRLRVETCIGTIIDVHKSVTISCENEKILSQFEKLRRAVNEMDMSQVSEQDVLLVEQATNALLNEFRTIFSGGLSAPIYESTRH
jgi:hypothetical protein